MFGIKQEEPKDEENNNKQGENNILNGRKWEKQRRQRCKSRKKYK